MTSTTETPVLPPTEQRVESHDEHNRDTTMFIKVLLKFLSTKDVKMYVEAKRVILICLKKNQEGEQEYMKLSTSLLCHLRKLIGGTFWKQAESCFVRYLRDKEGMSASESESKKNQVAMIAAIAYSDLKRRNLMRKILMKSWQNESQQNRSNRGPAHEPQYQTVLLPLSRNKKRSVRFGKVQIRHFEVAAGDNPSCSSGVPITLSWKHNPVDEEVTIDDFEKSIAARISRGGKPSRLSANDRYTMLAKRGIPVSQIIEAQEECRRLYTERSETLTLFLKLKQMKTKLK